MLVECQQRDTQWTLLRHGKVTASRMADVLAVLKNGGESAARRNYKIGLLAERLTGLSADSYVSPEMAWGIEQEPFARAAYEVRTGVMVDEVGFFIHPKILGFGASPDGLVGADGLVEIKCPKTSTHLAYLLDGVVPEEHKPQMLGQMACAERRWCDFVSYDPRLPEHLQLFVVRFERDDKRIAEIEAAVVTFLDEINVMEMRLRGNHENQ